MKYQRPKIGTVRESLINGGVRNLREFGYPSCDADNILTDYIYAKFFDRMLEEHQGNEKEVGELRAEISKSTSKAQP